MPLVFCLLFNLSCSQLKEDVYPIQTQETNFPGKEWEKVENPEALGWSQEKLDGAREYADKIGTQSLMIVDEGKLIAAWGDTRKKFYIASVRKSLLSTLFGFFPDSIDLNATLAAYGIDDKNPSLNDQEKQAKIRDLLSSTSGVYHPAAATDNKDLPPRNSKAPGSEFYYNNWDFNALGTIFERRTGRKVFEEFNNRIAQPIGMQDFNYSKDGRYDYSDVSIHPAYHFDMTTRDMARFALLVLREGKWEDRQVLNPTWLKESTSAKITVGESYGGGSYGYMWWIHDSGRIQEGGVPRDAFSAQGNWSQIMLIVPSKDLVIVHRAYKRDIDPEKFLQLIRMLMEAHT